MRGWLQPFAAFIWVIAGEDFPTLISLSLLIRPSAGRRRINLWPLLNIATAGLINIIAVVSIVIYLGGGTEGVNYALLQLCNHDFYCIVIVTSKYFHMWQGSGYGSLIDRSELIQIGVISTRSNERDGSSRKTTAALFGQDFKTDKAKHLFYSFTLALFFI